MLNIANLIVEVTRKCNMFCEHCLRGEAQNVDIDSLFDQVEHIGNVTFTGGEPSLNVPALNYFLEQAKLRRVSISNFYIATNGKAIEIDFVIFLLKMFAYCDEKEFSSVDISNDIFHNMEGGYDMELLQGLSFVHKKFGYDNDNYNYNNYESLQGSGRAADYVGEGTNVNHGDIPEARDEFDYAEIYLNARGNIVIGCDYSFEDQDNKYTFCKVEDLQATYEELEEY